MLVSRAAVQEVLHAPWALPVGDAETDPLALEPKRRQGVHLQPSLTLTWRHPRTRPLMPRSGRVRASCNATAVGDTTVAMPMSLAMRQMVLWSSERSASWSSRFVLH